MPQKGVAQEGYYIEHPNREKASSKMTKAIVTFLLLGSAALTAVISWGGWETLEGAKALQIAYIILYVVIAFLIFTRWNRGLLPVASALAIILLIFAAVSGPQWFDRDKAGFNSPTLDEDILGLLTFILVPLQVLVIAFAMRGFAQQWNVEVERPIEGYRRDAGTGGGTASPQPA